MFSNSRVSSIALLALTWTLSGCEPGSGGPSSTSGSDAAAGPLWFRDVTDDLGVEFVHDPALGGDFFMPENIGSGVALLDFDLDGRLDIYLVQNAGSESASRNRLYQQQADGRFKDVSAGSGLDVAGRGMGVAIGDVNNDGRPEVFLSEYGRIRLFRNDGGGKFSDVSEAAGVASPLWATSASFLDYDRDGWLDLVVTDYVNYDPSRWCGDSASRREYCGPDAFPGTVTKLFRNLGAGDATKPRAIRFEDATLKSGLASSPGPGLGVVCLDFDGDRWCDIFVANDGAENHLWINRRDGTFVDEAVARGIALNTMGRTEANMGIAIGDVDGDLLFDVFVTHLADETPTLWRQRQRGFFDDSTTGAGLSGASWRGTGFGTVMADFDCDGRLDLAAVNGRVRRGSESHADDEVEAALDPVLRRYAQRDQLFVNAGGGKFRDISVANGPFCGLARVSRGIACGDLDGDGAPDLVVTAIGGRARIFRNVAERRGHWLRVRAVDPALSRDAYGAELTVRIGERRLWRWINPAYSFLSSSDARAHFGLGEASRIDAIEVVWPNGSGESFPGGEADREIVLEKGAGREVPE